MHIVLRFFRKYYITLFLSLIVVFTVAALYIYINWQKNEKEFYDASLVIVETAADMLPADDLKKLEALPEDSLKPEYRKIKKLLTGFIKNNADAKFAYLFKLKDENIYFIGDSEPENSPDYSPPGQSFPEASDFDFIPFRTGNHYITPPVRDRWGEWISVYVPVSDESTGEVIAVFGVDYPAWSFNKFILNPLIQAVIISVIFFVLLFLSFNVSVHKDQLEKEIEERKKIESELRKSNAQKDKFFSIISHDLRSPFMGLLGYTEILKEDSKDMPREDLAAIGRDLHVIASSLYRMLNNLLDWARMQKGTYEFNTVPLSLHKLVQSNIEVLKARSSIKHINIVNNVDKSFIVKVDEKMINSVLQNLISNSIKFTRPEGVVTICSEPKANSVKISVTDNGIGIPAALLPKLFDLTEKTGRRGTAGEESTGIGLILTREFIIKHGGAIYAESSESKGSTFYFTLPLA